MYNIIRGMPMVSATQDGRVQWWLPGSGQLGAEGYLMGTTYMVFSLSLATLTYVVPRVTNEDMRTSISLIAMGLSFFMLTSIMALWQSKTGMRARNFLWG